MPSVDSVMAVTAAPNVREAQADMDGAPKPPVKCERCNRPTYWTPDGPFCSECGTTYRRTPMGEREVKAQTLKDESAIVDAAGNLTKEWADAAKARFYEAEIAAAGLAKAAAGLRYNEGKPPYHLLDAYALEQCARVMGKGADKYAPNNWRNGLTIAAQFGSLLRHVFAALSGEDRDKESGELHMAHAMVNCMFILWTLHARPDLDDRWKYAAAKHGGAE